MTYCNLLEFPFVSNFHNKKIVEFSLTSFVSLKYDCVTKTIETFNFLSLINSSVTIGSSFFVINHISNHTNEKLLMLCVSFLDCILQYFYKYFSYHLSIQ